SETGPSAGPSPIKGGATASKAQTKASTGRRLVVYTGGAKPVAPRFDAGRSPPGGPSALLIARGEETTSSPTGGSAVAISPTPDSGSKLSAVSLSGEIAEFSGGVPRLKSRLSSPPPVPTKQQREVGSSNKEEGRVEKRDRVVLSSDSDDDGETLTLLRRKRSVRGGQSRGGAPPPTVLDGVPGGSGPSSVPIALALEACPTDGEDALMTDEAGRIPRVRTTLKEIIQPRSRSWRPLRQRMSSLSPPALLRRFVTLGCFYIFQRL
ncbi:hypothetical protein PanWU01x14_017420, partial [Parasponia andersonii]